MSMVDQTEWALVRSICVALCALLLSIPLGKRIAATRGSRSVFVWALLLAPWFTPALLVSYAYSRIALVLGATPHLLELLYALILLLRLVPIATLAICFIPSPLSDEGAHCHQLQTRTTAAQRFRFRVRGAGPAPLIAFALVFLFAFGEFELASLWNVRTWTVKLFDAQAGGLALRESLRLALAPLLCQVAVLLPVILLFRRVLPIRRLEPSKAGAGTRCYLATSATIGALVPLLFVLGQSVQGWRALAHGVPLNEIAVSALFAASAAAGVFTLTTALQRRATVMLALCTPGLLGALLLSLLILVLFQFRPLQNFYDTPLPLLIALIFLQLPLALLLRLLVRATRPAAALHLARLLRARELLWELESRRTFYVLFLLFCCGYFDFTAASILAPVGMTPVFVRLHNLAHYGQTPVLSAMLCAAYALPTAVLLLMPLARHFHRSRL